MATDLWESAGFDDVRGKSGGGPPRSKTLARWPMAPDPREASWIAPVLWRFGKATGSSKKARGEVKLFDLFDHGV